MSAAVKALDVRAATVRCLCGCEQRFETVRYVYRGPDGHLRPAVQAKYLPGHKADRLVPAGPVWERLLTFKARTGLSWRTLELVTNLPALALKEQARPGRGTPRRMRERRALLICAELDRLEAEAERWIQSPLVLSAVLPADPLEKISVKTTAKALAERFGGKPEAYRRALFRARRSGRIKEALAEKVAAVHGMRLDEMWSGAA